jgi:SAM-dependent methyltransferase
MHDTAFQIGTLAMNIYADLRTDCILDVGSQAVNGSLRDNALPNTRYVGVDIEEGAGVDLVVEPGKPLPVDDDSFDLVMASSVFEHDPCFWVTFLEMCRAAKDGGYIYINAPSNGAVHRYPQDNWRFYPDSGKALAQWAASQGSPVTLVESFIACREDDIWNDFVAVFRKGPIRKTLPKIFLHEHVPCTNVITWKSKQVINPSDEPEDMVLLRRADERARFAEEEMNRASEERGSLAEENVQLKSSLAQSENERQRQLAETEKARSDLNLRESELRQRHEEIEQTRSYLAQSRSETAAAERELVERQTKFDQLQKSSEGEIEKLERQLTSTRADFEREKTDLVRALIAAEERLKEHERRWSDHFHETAALSKMLLEREQLALKQANNLQRVREIHQALEGRPRWWALLPSSRRSQLEQRKLHRLGLFDGQGYLLANPDVAAAGEDPVHHYIFHGLDEQRPMKPADGY